MEKRLFRTEDLLQVRDEIRRLKENASPLGEFSLCLSRACLGKRIISSIKLLAAKYMQRFSDLKVDVTAK